MLKIQPGADITAAVPTFYEDEPDPNQRDAPRVGIVVSFANGKTVRYHPSAKPIWSDELQPTKAMQMRYNRARKLHRIGSETLDRMHSDASQLAA